MSQGKTLMQLPKKPEPETKTRTRKQLMADKARSMPGRKVSFRIDPEDPLSRRAGWIVSAKVGSVDPVSNLLGWDVVIRGKSGKEVQIDSNINFMKIYWDQPKAW